MTNTSTPLPELDAFFQPRAHKPAPRTTVYPLDKAKTQWGWTASANGFRACGHANNEAEGQARADKSLARMLSGEMAEDFAKPLLRLTD